jgi:Xaa-Pro dipeptidase
VYLSGCHIPGSFIVICRDNGQIYSELFIPKADAMDIMWSIPPPDLSLAQEKHDVSKVSYSTDLAATLNKVVETHPKALIHTLPRNSPLFPNLPDEYTQFNADSGVTDAFLLKALHQARLVKTEEEIELIRKANAVSSRAHEVVMKVLGLGVRDSNRKQIKKEGAVALPSE